MRDQLKCSECRRKKIKCRGPPNRPAHQKCDSCRSSGASCGPNYRKKDDPACSGLRNEATANQDDSIRDAEEQPQPPIPLSSRKVRNAGSVDRQDGDWPSPKSEEEAAHLLENLESLGISYAFGSQLTPVYCCNPANPYKYNKGPEDKMKAIMDESHSLFMRICQSGLQHHEQGMDNDADRLFKKLIIALDRYPGLVDGRKYNALWNISEFYRVKGTQNEREWVLTKATEAHDPSLHPNDPYQACQLLAASLHETSRRIADDLRKLWKKNFMVDGETSLAIPPIQRSAQHRNADVALRLLAHPNSIAQMLPALFNQEALHISATRGYEPHLKGLLSAGAEVDARDLHSHTALFLAAAEGHEGCCAELIKWKADVNAKDCHGTTILGVAAGAGHLRVVQLLVKAKAEVNPELPCCTSSPLQAAIENPKSPIEVALFLLGANGDVSVRRKDRKNAIDLAEARCSWLAVILRQKESLGPQRFFEPDQRFYFDQSHLDFSPGFP